jgi:hypothetical protein
MSGCWIWRTTPNYSSVRPICKRMGHIPSVIIFGGRATRNTFPLYEGKMVQAYDHRASDILCWWKAISFARAKDGIDDGRARKPRTLACASLLTCAHQCGPLAPQSSRRDRPRLRCWNLADHAGRKMLIHQIDDDVFDVGCGNAGDRSDRYRLGLPP